MFLKNLELKNFRNYGHVNTSFDRGTILIVGDNGQGKTNLLESIYYLSAGKSHRSSSTREIINSSRDYALLRAQAVSGGKSSLIEIELRRDGGYKIRVDKVYRKKKADFINLMPAVVFSPEDLNLIKGSPSYRRAYLDGILDRTVKGFPELRLKYQKTLAQRNSLLKSMGQNAGPENPTLQVWNEKLISYGKSIMEYRIKLLDAIKEEFGRHMDYFFGGSGAGMSYIASWQRQGGEGSLDDIHEQYKKSMERFSKKDMALAATTIGPHRDDVYLSLEGRDLRNFGSQGQQRIASLSLRLCELLFIGAKLGLSPLFLLDDVLSELDITRKQLLIEKLGDRFQAFITAANVNYLNDLKINICGKYEVKNGNLKRIM
ncbi:MAG: DNA replication/repair protein RecF [Actinomycetota bacterium]